MKVPGAEKASWDRGWCSRPSTLIQRCSSKPQPCQEIVLLSISQPTMTFYALPQLSILPEGPTETLDPALVWCGLGLHNSTASLQETLSQPAPYLHFPVTMSVVFYAHTSLVGHFQPQGISKAANQIHLPTSLKVTLLKSFRKEAEMCDER